MAICAFEDALAWRRPWPFGAGGGGRCPCPARRRHSACGDVRRDALAVRATGGRVALGVALGTRAVRFGASGWHAVRLRPVRRMHSGGRCVMLRSALPRWCHVGDWSEAAVATLLLGRGPQDTTPGGRFPGASGAPVVPDAGSAVLRTLAVATPLLLGRGPKDCTVPLCLAARGWCRCWRSALLRTPSAVATPRPFGEAATTPGGRFAPRSALPRARGGADVDLPALLRTPSAGGDALAVWARSGDCTPAVVQMALGVASRARGGADVGDLRFEDASAVATPLGRLAVRTDSDRRCFARARRCLAYAVVPMLAICAFEDGRRPLASLGEVRTARRSLPALGVVWCTRWCRCWRSAEPAVATPPSALRGRFARAGDVRRTAVNPIVSVERAF